MEINVSVPGAVFGFALILLVLWDAFETVVFPRRVTRKLRLARTFYRHSWLLWSTFSAALFSARRREQLLSFYGPLSLIILLSLWAGILISGFALLYWASGPFLQAAAVHSGFGSSLYFSGTTFFTLGLGDTIPTTSLARLLTTMEAGVGFGFLAMVIGYLPALNQSFSRREVSISLLDARAGSPPTAAEILRRHSDNAGLAALQDLLHDWELWSADLLESHLSYPVLAYFRSQHDNQSWLAALTAVLDASALVMSGIEGTCARQAQLTFAMARHAVVDLTLIFYTPPEDPRPDRLPPERLDRLRAALEASGLRLRDNRESDARLSELRKMYEPYVYCLSRYFHLALPPWIYESVPMDNWQQSAWERHGRSRQNITPEGTINEHF